MTVSLRKKHIVILCSRLDLPGGIERAIVNTANLFHEHGNKVSVVVLDNTAESFYPLHPLIDVIQRNLNFGITDAGNVLSRKLLLLKNIRSLKQILSPLQADIIIGTEYHLSIAAYFAAKKSPAKLMAWEHHHFYWFKRSFFWEQLFKRIYPKLACVICLNTTEQMLFDSIGCKTAVVPNFVENNTYAETRSKTILTIGWLIKRKGVDMIPLIAQKIFAKHPDWKWKIIGTGDNEIDLRKEIDEKSLAGNIEISKPFSHDLGETYQQASIFVMTSRFECFPMVLLEAMSYGVPCISFDCPTGPADIIQNGIDGILVEKENTADMADAIVNLIESDKKRKLLAVNGFENIKRFSPKLVYEMWKELFNENANKDIPR